MGAPWHLAGRDSDPALPRTPGTHLGRVLAARGERRVREGVLRETIGERAIPHRVIGVSIHQDAQAADDGAQNGAPSEGHLVSRSSLVE